MLIIAFRIIATRRGQKQEKKSYCENTTKRTLRVRCLTDNTQILLSRASMLDVRIASYLKQCDCGICIAAVCGLLQSMSLAIKNTYTIKHTVKIINNMTLEKTLCLFYLISHQIFILNVSIYQTVLLFIEKKTYFYQILPIRKWHF